MFDEIQKQQKSGLYEGIRIQASYLEIYNETVLDLLNPQNSGLPIRWNQERGFFVERLYIVDCDSLDDCLAVLEEGLRNRTTGAHASNEHSSRSHSLLTINLEIKGYKSNGVAQNRYGKISFVDLAGSEKVKESKATFDTFTEALSINKSLLTLGKCIAALSDAKTRQGHIPFRDSKLTKLLSDSLSGNGSALMIACISPSAANLNETFKTLRYAMQAKKIQNRPIIQLDPQEERVLNLKIEIMGLKKENSRLKELLKQESKYTNEVRQIQEETELYIKRLKSRPNSPLQRPRASSIHDRSSFLLPAVSSNSKTPPAKSRNQVVPLPRITTSAKTQRSTAPSRASTTSRRTATKSAAKQRIDELKRSDAPASHRNSLVEANANVSLFLKGNVPKTQSKNSNEDNKSSKTNTNVSSKAKQITKSEEPKQVGSKMSEKTSTVVSKVLEQTKLNPKKSSTINPNLTNNATASNPKASSKAGNQKLELSAGKPIVENSRKVDSIGKTDLKKLPLDRQKDANLKQKVDSVGKTDVKKLSIDTKKDANLKQPDKINEKRAQFLKRPSAIESRPDIELEPFPEPHKNLKSPDPAKVIENRHQIKKEVDKLEQEIKKEATKTRKFK